MDTLSSFIMLIKTAEVVIGCALQGHDHFFDVFAVYDVCEVGQIAENGHFADGCGCSLLLGAAK